MQQNALVFLAIFLFGTLVICNAEYRYKFRPPRPPAPYGYKKWGPPPMMAQHRSYRKPTIYRYAPPPPPPPPKRPPPPFARRPYKSHQMVFPNPLWQPKAIFPNPYQQIPVSLKEQQVVKSQQYFKDPLLKEPLILKNPQLFEQQFARPQPQSISAYQPGKYHFLQEPPRKHAVHHQPPPQAIHANQVVLKSPLNLDTEREGPIRTIPAPNLSAGHRLQPATVVLQQMPQYKEYLQPVQAPLSRPLAIHQYHVTEEPSNDLRVRDPYTGAQKLYAPDPDPKIPAPPVRPAIDPFSMPSNGKPLPLDIPRYTASQQTHSSSKGLSTQEFYDLLNSFPLPHSQDNIYQSSNQPQLHQHLLQQAHGLPLPTINSALAYIQQPSSIVLPNQYTPEASYLQQQPSTFQPQYHNFNFDEQGTAPGPEHFYPGSQGVYQQDEAEFQSQASQKIPTILPLAEPERVNELSETNLFLEPSDNQQGIEQLINSEHSAPSANANNNVKMDNALTRNYFTTLPNRQAAETLATLQAAGSINSNLMNILRKKQQEGRFNSEKKIFANTQNNEPTPTPQNDSTMRIFVPDYTDSYEDDGDVITAENQNARTDNTENSHQQQNDSEEWNPGSRANIPNIDSTTSKIQESTIIYGKKNKQS